MPRTPIQVTVKESEQELRQVLETVSPAIYPRIQMLLSILAGTSASGSLIRAGRVGPSDQAIRAWKKIYNRGGIEALMHDGRCRVRKSAAKARQEQ